MSCLEPPIRGEESLFDTPEILQVCHSEGGQRLTEESLLSTRDSLKELPLLSFFGSTRWR
ncbi:hypothetical protein [Helicobacter marmotae]|uniref:hypothetical protein n=1 Tax=Helicobacter marmotae TaxID=152490 RepID=UPI0011C02C35|nr:hypothetical protein [Helicobacter marmotae]